MKTLLALTTTVLSLAVLTGCKKETYGDPMKFAQKYFLEEIMSPGYKITDPLGKSMPLKELMKIRGYTGFEVLSARLSSTPYGEEVVECTVGIKTSGEYEYYYLEKFVFPSNVGARRIQAVHEKGEGNEEWVSRLNSIGSATGNEPPLSIFKSISTSLSFRTHAVRRQVDGVYIPVMSYERRKNGGYEKEEDANQMWCFTFDEKMKCFSSGLFATSEEIKNTKNYFISGTPEQIQGYNMYSQRVRQAELLSDEIRKKQVRLWNINASLESKEGWRRVEGEERIKLEKEQQEVKKTLGELKKQVLTL